MLTVLTLKSAVARDFHGGTKGLSDEMARRPVIGRIPVRSLVLDLVQGGQPASPCAGSRVWAGSGGALASLHLFGFSASNLPKGLLGVSGSSLKTLEHWRPGRVRCWLICAKRMIPAKSALADCIHHRSSSEGT